MEQASRARPGGVGFCEAFSLRVQHIAPEAVSTDACSRPGLRSRLAASAARGFDVRTHPLTAAFAAALMLVSPVHAIAQDEVDQASVRERPREDYDPLGLRFGGFDLHASIDFDAAATDNLFATETAEQEDTIYSIAPRARLASHWSRHQVALETGARFTMHDDFSGEDTETFYVGADGRLDVGGSSSLSGRARFAREVEPRTNPDALTVAEPVEYDRTDLSITAQHAFNRLRLRGTIASLDYDYEDAGLIDQDFRDSNEVSAIGRVEAELTPRIAALVEARFDEREYDNTPSLSSEGQTYLAGVAVNLTDLMRGEISVGQFNRSYDSGGDVDGTAVSGNLDWYVTRLTTLQFNASRSAEESGATVALPYVETRYGARVDHELLRNLILSAGVQAGQREYETIDREDEYMSGFAGAEYLLNRRVVLRGRYNYDEMESTGVARYRDFEVNTFTLGLSLRL